MSSTRRSPITRAFLVVVVLCATALAFVVWRDGRSALHYAVRFDDAKGLSVGAPVEIDGTRVGTVEGVREVKDGVEVDLRIDGDSVRKVGSPPNTTARIHRGTPIVGRSHVEIVTRGDGGSPPAAGTVIQGLEGWTEEALWRSTVAVEKGRDSVLAAGQDSLDWLAEIAESDESVKVRESVEGFLEKVEKAAREDAPRAWNEAVAQGKELIAQVDTDRAKEIADEVGNSLESLVEKSKSLEGEARENALKAIEELKGLKAKAADAAGNAAEKAKEVAEDAKEKADEVKEEAKE